eukprot:SAG31_NODE_18756_length_624_cov_0.569524_1_plen_107_part_00
MICYLCAPPKVCGTVVPFFEAEAPLIRGGSASAGRVVLQLYVTVCSVAPGRGQPVLNLVLLYPGTSTYKLKSHVSSYTAVLNLVLDSSKFRTFTIIIVPGTSFSSS